MSVYKTMEHVTNKTIDKMCDRYTSLGWKEVDISGTPNHIETVTFEIECDGFPTYPVTSDIK